MFKNEVNKQILSLEELCNIFHFFYFAFYHIKYISSMYRIYSINLPGRLLNFHYFQQVKYVYFATKQ